MNYLEDKSKDERLQNRIDNIFWTLAENYDLKMPLKIKDSDFAQQRFEAIFWGGIYYLLEPKKIEQFFQKMQKKPERYAAYSQLFFIGLEEYVMPRISKQRPTIHFYRMVEMERRWQIWKEKKPEGIAEILWKAYLLEKSEVLNAEEFWLKGIMMEVMRLAEQAQDTDSFLYGLEQIFEKFFAEEHWIEKRNPVIESLARGEKISASLPEHAWMERKFRTAGVDVEEERIVDAEFNPNSYRGKVSKDYLEAEQERGAKLAHPKAKQKQTDYEKVRLFFGDLSVSDEVIRRLEQKLANGIHEHKKFYLTRGNFSDYVSDYQIRFLKQQRDFNLEYWEVHQRVGYRNIESLRSLIKNALLPESREDRQISDYGILDAKRAWNVDIFHSNNIFQRITKNEIGNFAVEILLDGSGSQSERQAEIAMQGYIIARALGECKIPCRISAYATFLDYTILRIYKDFEDGMEKAGNIFDFFGTGMNRDGLAFRLVGELLEKRSEDNKVLIVLSDGRPNDVRVFKKEMKHPEKFEYTGEHAISDAAMEVRKLRMKGISVLGIFNGLEEDLNAQQIIFGRDFAYIKKLKQFSKIVGNYLKRELSKYME